MNKTKGTSTMPKLTILSLTAWHKIYGDDVSASLYVVNTNNRHGTIMFSVAGNNGITSNICVPPTFVPIDLTTLAPLAALIVSEDFRRLVQQGHLTIVDNKEVESPDVQNNPKIRREMERVLGIARDVETNDTTGKLTLTIGSNETTTVDEMEIEQDSIESDELIQQIIGLTDNEELLENLLDSRGSELTTAQLEYLRQNSKSTLLSNFCVEALDTM